MNKHRVLHNREAKRVFGHQTSLTLNTFLEKGVSFKKHFMISTKKSTKTEITYLIDISVTVRQLPSLPFTKQSSSVLRKEMNTACNASEGHKRLVLMKANAAHFICQTQENSYSRRR